MGYDDDYCEFGVMNGKTLKSIEVNDDKDEIVFTCDDGKSFLMYHEQDCCESVTIEDICGDLSDLIGSELLLTEEVKSEEDPDGVDADKDRLDFDSSTWTFYKISTMLGSVTIRWYGTSNGYYSESVDFKVLT